MARVAIPMEIISVIEKCMEDNGLPTIDGNHTISGEPPLGLK